MLMMLRHSLKTSLTGLTFQLLLHRIILKLMSHGTIRLASTNIIQLLLNLHFTGITQVDLLLLKHHHKHILLISHILMNMVKKLLMVFRLKVLLFGVILILLQFHNTHILVGLWVVLLLVQLLQVDRLIMFLTHKLRLIMSTLHLLSIQPRLLTGQIELTNLDNIQKEKTLKFECLFLFSCYINRY